VRSTGNWQEPGEAAALWAKWLAVALGLGILYYVVSRLFLCSLPLHPWPFCGDTISWSETWTMLAGIGAVGAASVTVWYVRLVSRTLAVMTSQHLDAARPVVVLSLPLYDVTGVTILFSNIGVGPALDTKVEALIEGKLLMTMSPTSIAAGNTFESPFPVPPGFADLLLRGHRGTLAATYRDVFDRSITTTTPFRFVPAHGRLTQPQVIMDSMVYTIEPKRP
jgi:hypothetical protein